MQHSVTKIPSAKVGSWGWGGGQALPSQSPTWVDLRPGSAAELARAPPPPPEMATVCRERFTKRQEGLMGWTQRIGLQYLFYQSAQLILLLDYQTLLSSSFLALFILN